MTIVARKTPGIREKVREQKGFTRLGRIIAGALLLVLAGVIVSSYFFLLKRARQVEAPAALVEIKRLEAIYFAFNSCYGTIHEIGYHPRPGPRYFKVTIELTPPSGGQPTGFKATARGNIDLDQDEDVWTIVENGTPQHIQPD